MIGIFGVLIMVPQIIMTFDDNLFASYTRFDEPRPVRVGNIAVILAYGYGDINVQIFVNGKCTPAVLRNVWYVPELRVNLFSLIIYSRNERLQHPCREQSDSTHS